MELLNQVGLWIGGAALVASAISTAGAAISHWAVLGHQTRLATIAAAAGREAGRIADLLGDMDPAAVTPAAKTVMIQQGGEALMSEFSTLAPKVALTADKATLMVWGELGKISNVAAINSPLSASGAVSVFNALARHSAIGPLVPRMPTAYQRPAATGATTVS